MRPTWSACIDRPRVIVRGRNPNAGTGINAPAISYAVNGKQYVAVLVGSRQPNNIIPQSPELKNTATASMLFVFSL